MIRLTILLFCFAITSLSYAQKDSTKFDKLYQKGKTLRDTYPDSAIHYAQLAIKTIRKPNKQAKAHWLIGFCSRKQGYYSMAIQHYKQAYNLYKKPLKKASVLENIAWCYENAGNYKAAIPIATKAIKRYQQLQDSARLARALHLLANCQRHQKTFSQADISYRQALQIAQQQNNTKKLASIYSNFSQLKEATHEPDSAIYYQRYAIDRFEEKDLSKKSIRFIRLAWYYLHVNKLAAAQRCLSQAQALKPRIPKAWVYFNGVRGLLHHLAQQETQARQAYRRFDSLLHAMRPAAASLVQHRFTHKTAYTIYNGAYKLLSKAFLFKSADKQYHARITQWYKEQGDSQKEMFDKTKAQIVLQDSLVVVSTKSTTIVKVTEVRKISMYWLLILGVVFTICARAIYRWRTKTIHAHADFVKTIKRSPIKGFEDMTSQEIQILIKIEKLLPKKLLPKNLNSDDVKILLMIARGFRYKDISPKTGLKEGAIKTRVKRIKDLCGLDNIRDVMPKIVKEEGEE